MGYDGVKHTLNLSSFTLQEGEISHSFYLLCYVYIS